MWAPVGQSVALLLDPYAEVVLHDPGTDRVMAIWNPMGYRGPGDPSLLCELDALHPSARDVFGLHEKLFADGRRLSSVSAVLRKPDGKAAAALYSKPFDPWTLRAKVVVFAAIYLERRPSRAVTVSTCARILHAVTSVRWRMPQSWSARAEYSSRVIAAA